MSGQKALTLRLDLETWEKFKIKLIQKDMSAQKFFEEKVKEFLEAE